MPGNGSEGPQLGLGGTRGIQQLVRVVCCVTAVSLLQGKLSSNSYIAPLTVVTRWGICSLKICVVTETWWDGQEAPGPMS